MKIQDPNLNGVQPNGVGGPNGPNRSQGPEGVGRPGVGGARGRGDGAADSVELSTLSRQLNGADLGPPERAQKVAALKAEYEAGRYNPDAKAVAASLVKDALEWKT